MNLLDKFRSNIFLTLVSCCMIAIFVRIIGLVILFTPVIIKIKAHPDPSLAFNCFLKGLNFSETVMRTPIELFKTLIQAPLVENAIMVMIVWVVAKLKMPIYFAFISLAALIYFTHATSPAAGVVASFLFVIMLAQYLLLSKHYGKFAAYFFTLITHFTYNLSVMCSSVLINNYMNGL